MSCEKIPSGRAEQPVVDLRQVRCTLEEREDEMLDEALVESFPASDPPASNRFD